MVISTDAIESSTATPTTNTLTIHSKQFGKELRKNLVLKLSINNHININEAP
jgi:hypothetical protein